MDLQEELLRCQRDLEWPAVLDVVASMTVSDGGRARVLALSPAPDEAGARMRLAVVREALSLAEADAPLPARSTVSILEACERARKAGVLSGVELKDIAQVSDVALSISRFVTSHRDEAPLLERSLSVDAQIGPLAASIRAKIGEDGEVFDHASPALGDARRAVSVARRQIQAKTQELIGRYREALQDGFFAERDGRYVLPVRSDAPFRVEGTVTGTSGSGATLYIEPRELQALSNQLRLAQAAAEREEELVRRALSALVRPLADELLWGMDVAERADLLSACVRFASLVRGRVCELGTEGEMVLKEARHPLLASRGVAVVPFDGSLHLGHGVVVSGPNAGGKTVALKTMGLFALMQSAGLPVPAQEGSRIGYFSKVFCDIGDDQSLSQSLSTFSGHVDRVRRILDESGPGVLVLFDELMAGTDPNEGAALAMALSECFVQRGATLVVTTHYEPLKSFGQSHPCFESAAVGFDFDEMRPTYQLCWGRAGASSALIVAARYGLPEAVVGRAQALLPELAVRLMEDRTRAESLVVELGREQAELRAELERQRLLSANIEREKQRLADARRRVLEDETNSLRASLADARRAVEKVRAALKNQVEPAVLQELSSELTRAASTVSIGSEVDRAVRTPVALVASGLRLEVGQRVRVVSLGVDGEIMAPVEKGVARVQAGVLKLSVPVSDLARPPKGAPREDKSAKSRFQPSQKPAPAPEVLAAPLRTEDVTLDLRGQRVEAGLALVDEFVDDLLRRNEFGGYILHGHGTGAMKDAVRRHVAAHPAVRESQPAERSSGGDAFTVIWLGRM